jgi:pimeloyl-ACP methyl ester carboxylesterase
MKIVFLHGLAASKNFFEEIERSLWEIGAETLSFDLLGFGENKEKGRGFSLKEHLSHINNEISYRFPRGKIVLVGHSMGGILALAWAKENQNRVSKIVLLNTPLFKNKEEAKQTILKSKTGWGYYLLSTPLFSRFACNILCQHNLMHFFKFLKPAYIPDVIFSDYRLHTFKSLNETFKNIVVGTSGLSLLSSTPVPVLNIIAENDLLSNHYIDQKNIITKILPGGHLTPLKYRNNVIDEIKKFLLK